ncbi:SPOR domain-containing protein [Paenibacillus sp. DYY-L-2]|uniref:SPOR domain-containing protein n=1 Tax=Paenibacillus sp. DYY-L-2 TaxID=3447013 RepID=UPI003F50B0F6
MNKAKMTFRFDQQGRQTPEVRPIHAMPAKVNEVEEPFLEPQELKELEELKEPAEPKNTEETQHFRPVDLADDWGDPFTDYTGTGGAILPAAYQPGRTHRTSWWKVAGSVTGAIVTGALFGFVVLSMFTGEVTVPIPGISTSVKSTAEQPARDLSVFGPVSNGNADEMLVNIALPSQTYYFLQYGVFSTAEGVELAQKELQQSGIAAARDTVDEKRVYAGVSNDREQAKLLSSQLKTAGVHLILHEMALPTFMEAAYDGDVTPLERYFSQSADLISLLSSLSASRLVEAAPQALSEAELKELGQKHQLWTESAAAIRGNEPEAFAEEAAKMEKSMNSAIEAMAEYNKNGAKTLLWEVQDEVMDFILAEQKMAGAKG